MPKQQTDGSQEQDWNSFCAKAAAMMRGALENKITLKEASDFFSEDKTITDPDLRRYVESMVWEFGGSPGYYVKLVEMFEARTSEEDLVKWFNA